MAVTDVKNRDINRFFKQKIPCLAHTKEKHLEASFCHHERKAQLLHPTIPMPPFIRGNDLHGINATGPRSDYCTSYQHIYTRTVPQNTVVPGMTHMC